MKVSVGRDSENSLKIVTVPLKSGLLATMVFSMFKSLLNIAVLCCVCLFWLPHLFFCGSGSYAARVNNIPVESNY